MPVECPVGDAGPQPPMTMREGQTFDGGPRWVSYVNFVKLPHTVFLLPFALVGATLGSYAAPVTAAKAVWIVLAFTSARFAAMGFNRIVDRDFDARNPRTARRELPSGTLTLAEARVAVAIAAVMFTVAAWRLSALCLGALSHRARMGLFLQLHQAVHAVVDRVLAWASVRSRRSAAIWRSPDAGLPSPNTGR